MLFAFGLIMVQQKLSAMYISIALCSKRKALPARVTSSDSQTRCHLVPFFCDKVEVPPTALAS